MHFIDTHSHLYHQYYRDEFEETVQRALSANVRQIVLPCVTSANIMDLFMAHDQFPENLYPLVGLHPTDVKPQNFRQELSLLKSFLEDSRIIGIGECGMDLYWDKQNAEEQKEAFKMQLEWARDFQLPLSIHIRDAYAETFEILNLFRNNGIKGVMHCFSGGIQEAIWAVKFGFYLGIGGVVTFKNSKLQNIVKEIGLDHLVLETDSPFLAPAPFRGKTNESAYIPYIAEKLAALFETGIENIMEVTSENALRVFDKLQYNFNKV